jgi:hypothetical protein
MVAGQYLPWVIECASTHSPINQGLTLLSMVITLSRHSRPTVFQHFIWPFLHSKRFTGHGPVVLIVQNMKHLPLHFVLHVRRLMTIMRKPQSPLHTLCQWVWMFCPCTMTHHWHIFSSQSKGENGIFQEALVCISLWGHSEMCWGGGMLKSPRLSRC